MQLFALGINHRTAPVALRERVAFSFEQIKPALHELKAVWHGCDTAVAKGVQEKAAASEAAILSTCNRTELYCVAPKPMPPEQAMHWLAQYHRVSLADLAPHLYTLASAETVRHAFRVASGLDSMVLGETQIAGQLKDAVRTAAEAGALGTYLHQLFQRSFAVAKEVRGQTEVGAHSVSMAAVAVRLAQRIFEDISSQRVLFIGAGKMIELCATHFAAHQPHALVVANRTVERGQQLAKRLNGQAILLSELPTRLHEFDIVVSCTASMLPLIGLGAVESAIRARRRRPMFILDLAVPRDVEPEVKQLSDVFLYTVDDLGALVQEGGALRQAAVTQAEAIIETRVQHFMQWVEARSVVPVIRDLYSQADELRANELSRAQKRLARGETPELVLESLSQALTNKFIHGPLHALSQADANERAHLAQLLPRLFKWPGSTNH